MSHIFKGVGHVISSITDHIPGASFLIPAALTYFGQPELAAAYSGLNTAGHGGSLGKALLSAGLSYGGSALGGSDTIFGDSLSAPISGALKSLGDSTSGALGDIGEATGLSSLYSDASGALSDGYKGISDALGNQYNGSFIQDAVHSGNDALKSIGLGGGSDIGSGTSTSTALSPQGGGGSSYGNVGTFGQGSTSFGTDLANNSLNPTTNLLNTGGKVASSTNYFSPIASLGIGSIANNNAEDALLKQANANKSLLAPYLNFKFSPGDLTQDPGYQFNLAQGNQALDRKALGPGGSGYFSGAALKDAQTFGQGLADNTYNAAFNRALQSNNAGLSGALATAGVNDSIGNTKAASAINEGNLFSGAFGNILGGNSYTNNGNLQGGSDIQSIIKRLFGNSGSSNYSFA